MEINKGDIVKVTNPQLRNKGVKGRTGKVQQVHKSACTVHLKWDAPEGSLWTSQGVLGSFDFDELEVVERADQKDQIEQIAHTLLTEGGFQSSSYALEVAASLYKGGCRHEG